VLSATDLAAIPWHNGTGAWGPQVRIESPAQPVTTRAITVSSLAQFNAEARVPGTHITIGASWPGNTIASINANDIRVTIPPNLSIGAIMLGNYPTTTVARTRIDGGGRHGQVRAWPGCADLTIAGTSNNGDSGFGGGETNQAWRIDCTRVALLDTRSIAPGYNWLGGARHLIIARSNFFHGAATRAATGFVEGWGIRNAGGPITIVDSRIQGTRYNNLRAQSSGRQGELLYVARSTFVNESEGGRAAWLWSNLGNGPWNGQGAIIEDSAIYSYAAPGCGSSNGAYMDLSAPNVTYTRLRRNRFYSGGGSSWSQQVLNGMAKLAGGDHDWSVGNTFAARPATLPPWGPGGDPTQIPLPTGIVASLRGETPCLAP
jgi:hypothetical protein